MEIENLKKSHEAVFICDHVFDNSMPILYVCKEDNEWQFLCGGTHELDAIPHVVGLGHLISRDNTLVSIMNMEDGFEAERPSVGEDWKISKIESD